MADRNARKRQRLGFDWGPLAGTATEQFAKRVQNVIEKWTPKPVFWRWHEDGYGVLAPTEVADQCVLIRVRADGCAGITVSVGSGHRQGWIASLEAAGYRQAATIDKPDYGGKVQLVFDSRDPLENETLCRFLTVPWLPAKERGAIP